MIDSTPPELIFFEMPSYSIDISAEDWENIQYGVNVEIIDQKSGVFEVAPSYVYDNNLEDYSVTDFSNNFFGISSLKNIYYNYAVWTSPSGVQQFAVPIYGDAEGWFSLSKYTENGIWNLDSFYLTDNVGNQTVLSTEDLIELGIETELEITGGLGIDSTPPILMSMESYESIDISETLNNGGFKFWYFSRNN